MNSFGTIFRLHIFGESHGKTVGIIIDGCPPGINVKLSDFETDLKRRKSGAKGTTSRTEPDIPEINSGVYKNKTTGSPITIFFKNTNIRSYNYNFRDHPRPGHADFTSNSKFKSFNDDRGGGHFSGRLTLGIVAAGVIAKKIINNIDISAKVTEVGGEKNIEKIINKTLLAGNSVGGIIECKAVNIPVGLGEPFFDSLESMISHAIFSVPGIKGIEFGSGFKSSTMTGSKHNDIFISKNGKTKTNNSGGISGGISNGNDFIFRVAVKPTSSIAMSQDTFNFKTKKIEKLKITGRHDACFALRTPVIIEAVTAVVLADLYLRNN